MVPTSVDRLLREIGSFKDRNPHLTSEMKDRIQTLQMELGFLKMFIWLLPKRSLRKSYIRAAVANGKRKVGFYGISDHAASKLLQAVELCKQKTRVDCHHLFDFSSHYNCRFSSSYELLQFIDCTISNLRNLVRFKSGAIVSVKMQVKALIKKLRIFRDFVKSNKQWLLFSIDIRDWAFKVACLSTLYWIDHIEEAMASHMKAVLSELLEMAKSCSLEVIRLWLLKASELSSYDRFQIGEFIESFVNFILPVGFMKVLHVKLAFLIAFLMDPPHSEMDAKGDILISAKVKAVASEIPSLICSLSAGEINEITVEERYALLGNFQEKTGKLMAEVRKLFILNPHSSNSHFPITNTLGFLDFLLENFGNLMDTLITMVSYIPFAKDQLVTLHKELVSLRPSLKQVQQLQNQLEELKDLWMRINDVAYRVEYVIDSCQRTDFPIWYNVICLSDLIEDTKLIKREIWEIIHKPTLNIGVLNAKVNSGKIHLNQANSFIPDEVVVGFKDEEEAIICQLTRGSVKLDIISIVGMPGQGKTTLARKVYNSPSVRYHFNRCGWCFVSQVYEEKMLLLDILRDITTMLEDEIRYLSKEDLSHKLFKCLSGQRYLLIMDDIWDITAWNALRESFPDDNNGSRIMFTSRNKFGCNPLLLRPLSEEESMELLKHKLFFKDGWPSNFSCDVQHIVNICNGLPLAIVVVAGLLKRASNNLDQWSEMVQNLDSKLTSEGCMDILELSYNHLPDFLKPCFLYIGAVGPAKLFKVRKLIQFWITEGFVQKSGTKSLEDVAMEYLEDLAGRSLVIVNKRVFSGGKIKECRIHDLLHELCLRKAEEERFMHFSNDSPYSLRSTNHEPYRLCISSGRMDSWLKNTWPIIRSLHFLPRDFVRDDLVSGFLSRLKFVRVLDMWNLVFGNRFPEEILSLISLRYLAIWCNVEVIPSSIHKLCNLESFHAKSWKNILQFPHTLWKMKTLRNVDVVGTAGATLSLDDHDDNVCSNLDNLDSFSSLYISNIEDAEKILGRFPFVRNLKLEFSKSWACRRDCDEFQVLHFLSKLESLNLQYSLKVAHTCALSFPTTLKKLRLSNFNCPWSKISGIGKLPNLEILKLQNSAVVEDWWDVGEEEFLKLKYLKLSILKISHWEASSSSFPCLERLVVRNCPFLVELPLIFEDIITLKMIEVRRCSKGLSTSVKSILSAHQDMGNEDLEVQISDVLDKDRWVLDSPVDIPGDTMFNSSPRDESRNISSMCYSIIHALETTFITDRDFKMLTWRKYRKFRYSKYSYIYDRMLPYYEIHDVQKPLGLDKKGIIESYAACLDKRYVRIASKAYLILKHNCQPRQVIMSRHRKMELKRDQ